jgi:uncharacterized protein YjbJ (UPF0337 family)
MARPLHRAVLVSLRRFCALQMDAAAPRRRGSMNWDSIQGNWKELKGKVRSKWAKLTDDDLEHIAGKKDVLLGRLQQRYGFKKDQAERELDDFLNGIPKH